MTLFDTLKNYVVGYFNVAPFLDSQAEAEKEIREGVSFRGTNIVILMIAIMIASLGLNTNSTAVIIGAMLISPLMGPIIGMGLAIGVEDLGLLKRAGRNLAVAALASVAVSALYFLISPVSEGHSELLARTSPTIYDVMIGFFGGGAGIVAIGSRSRGNVIPGVAIATALMPPLCTAGYGLATVQMNYFIGALYLFIINSIYIGLATYIGVKLMHYRRAPAAAGEPTRTRRRVRRIVYAVAVLTMLPSIWLTYRMLRTNSFELSARRFVAAEFQFPSTSVVSTRAYDDDGRPTIDVTLIGKVLPQDSLQMAMASKMKFFGLDDARLNIVQGDSPNPGQAAALSVKQVYDLTQASLTAKQATIDSLRAVIHAHSIADAAGAEMLPELRVVFPSVKAIAVERAVFAREDSASTLSDTLNVALVHFARPLPQARRAELERYIRARLKLPQVTIIPVAQQ